MRTTRAARWLPCLAPLLLTLAACAKPQGSANDSPVETCAKPNQSCRYADGKLGLCTPSSLECDGSASCLVCMSLH